MSSQPNLPIHQWPQDERPREKLLNRGADALTPAELLGVIIGSGTKRKSAVDLARDIITEFDSLSNLGKIRWADLKKIQGIGPAKAVSILACIELGKRIQSASPTKKIQVKGPKDIYDAFSYRFMDLDHEVFGVVLLDTANNIIKQVDITKGTLNQSVVHPREVFKAAIMESANAIILIHNHPSGNINPSNEDLKLTKMMVDTGKIMGINVLDHVIIAGKTFTSLADLGHI